jgi:energy-coupling factor transporter ATP-binding protein EcfA2
MLVLDEPTNGLDLPSRERVEEALESYPGTLLLVSHDRYLLERVATKVVAVQGGRIDSFAGGYNEYRQWAKAPARGGGDSGQGAGDKAAHRLLLETRLSALSARLGDPKAPDKEALNAEFIALSRELRGLRA